MDGWMDGRRSTSLNMWAYVVSDVAMATETRLSGPAPPTDPPTPTLILKGPSDLLVDELWV